MQDEAEKEERERAKQQESMMIFLYKNSGDFEQLKKEINSPD